MLIRATRSAAYQFDEALRLKEALGNVFRAPQEGVRHIGKRDLELVERLDYTYDGLASAERQLYHRVFMDKGLKSQVDFVSTPGGPKKALAKEFPKIDFQ